MNKKHWYKLDNVGKFYSFTNNDEIPAVFRYSVTLTETVDKDILQKALDESLLYFSNFNCHLKRGVFWYYLETSQDQPLVTEEDVAICSKVYKDEEDVLFRVNYYKTRINFEVSHILTDGRGSLTFFKCLVYKYLTIKYKLKDIEIESSSSSKEKNEDSFDKYYSKGKLSLPKAKNIYKYQSRKRKHITFLEYHISVKKTLDLAHKYNTSITGLLIAILIETYHNSMKQRDLNKTIKIDVPVDLRQYLKSDTSRNFFGVTSILYTYKEKDTFDDVVKSVNDQLKKKTTIEELKTRMNLMISLEKKVISRITPIFIKDFILRIADYVSSSISTSCISNIGKITVDKKLEKYIENFNVLNTTDSFKITLCSYKDDLSLGISSKYYDNDLIKDFCRFFKENDIEGIININEEDRYEKM